MTPNIGSGMVATAALRILAAPIGAALRSRLGEPWRHYHTWTHVATLLKRLSEAEAEGVTIHDPDACAVFCLWHDAVYDPQAVHGRNEELSALLCLAEAGDLVSTPSLTAAVAAIRATAGHVAPDEATCPDGALLLDVDLSILGAGQEDFAAYDIGIRLEYAHVPPEVYVPRRREVLGGFLRRERIFVTRWAHARWDAAARANLRAAADA